MTGAVMTMTEELAVEPILAKLVHAARELVNARYAALGVPDGAGGFAQFIMSGITDEEIEAIGPLPRQHGLLAAILEEPAPYRSADVQSDPRYQGWPDAHPDMHSLLGVPIISKGQIIAAFWLTDKEGAAEFTEADQQLIELLAAHAAIALENARLFERSRELSVVEERNRLARELHDSVAQTLFSTVLTAEAAATLIDRDAGRAKEQLRKLQELTRDAVQEMRSLIFELRPAELEADGLVPTLRKHVEVVSRVYHANVEVQVTGERRLQEKVERELFRIAQEALNNALKHSQAETIRVELKMNRKRVRLTVSDDGVGFEPADARMRSKRLGLTSMQERAEAVGGSLEIESCPGEGTKIRLELPVG
ncbi:MAG: GAF domain-containing sensor histidine kinase [Chloroflexi bacterium]|nr:GAF domain-containing sensor histidine kinase [Chloroflexota bacterium]